MWRKTPETSKNGKLKRRKRTLLSKAQILRLQLHDEVQPAVNLLQEVERQTQSIHEQEENILKAEANIKSQESEGRSRQGTGTAGKGAAGHR